MFLRKTLSSTFVHFFNIVKTRSASNDAKADAVRVAALNLQNELTAFKQPEAVTYYLHAAVHHLPDHIRDCVADVVDVSGSAIELMNKVVRTTLQ